MYCKYLAYCFLLIDGLDRRINHTQLYCLKVVEEVQFSGVLLQENKINGRHHLA